MLLIYFNTRQVKITIKHKSTITQYDVHWNDSIRELKERACKAGVVSESVALVHDGEELKDDKRWWQTRVRNTDDPILHLYNRWEVLADTMVLTQTDKSCSIITSTYKCSMLLSITMYQNANASMLLFIIM